MQFQGQKPDLTGPLNTNNVPMPEKSIGTLSPVSSSIDSPTFFILPHPYAQFSNVSLARILCESCISATSSTVAGVSLPNKGKLSHAYIFN